jgi:spore coat polysaccharide biosynthesis protein SpsF
VIGGRRVVAIVQARVGSTRLRGKVLLPLAGTPMVAHVLRRTMLLPGVDEVAAAVPEGTDDDPLAALAKAVGARVVRGPEDDVLARYDLAAAAADAEAVVRVTADCPLWSPAVGSRVLASFVGCDYSSNTQPRTFPRGLDTEVFTREVLRVAHREARDTVDREHVTPYIYRHPERFSTRNVSDSVDRSELRWTVDTPDDMAFARAVYQALGPSFEMHDVLALLAERPALGTLNSWVIQKPLGQ